MLSSFRKITIALSLILAVHAYPQVRERAVGRVGGDGVSATMPAAGTTVSGVVSSVTGNIISLAGGLVTIDASQAKISDDRGTTAGISSITPGSIVFAVLSSANVAANAPLPAMIIGVTRTADVTLGGPVQSVGGSSLTVLGRTITVNSNTSFGGRVKGLADIVANDNVIVQANAVGGVLVATSVLVFPPIPKPSIVIHGTVKSIGIDSWVITDRTSKDWTVVVNAQTKIAGEPKVGDTVDVLVNIDNSNQYVALSIIKSVPVPVVTVIMGEVKSIGTTSWVIRDSRANKDITVAVNAQTKISGDPKVNDGVIVTATADSAGNLTAVSIVKLGIVPPPNTNVMLRGVVKSIATTSWTIGPVAGLGPDVIVAVTAQTKIAGSPGVGDRVEVEAQSTANGYVAISIVKV